MPPGFFVLFSSHSSAGEKPFTAISFSAASQLSTQVRAPAMQWHTPVPHLWVTGQVPQNNRPFSRSRDCAVEFRRAVTNNGDRLLVQVNGDRMQDPGLSAEVVRFDIFEVDLRAGELRKQGRLVKLQEQPLRVLSLLLERSGEVVTRDELRQNLWPADTFVDFDHGLNSAVARLRQALRDSAEKPRLIETVAKRGYRFIGSLDARIDDAPAAQPAVPDSGSHAVQVALVQRHRRSPWMAGCSTSGSPGCDGALGLLPEDRRKAPAFNGGGAAGGTAGISGHAGLLSGRQSGRISRQRWRAQHRYLHDDGGRWKISPAHQRSRRLLPGLVARRPADRLHPLRRQNRFHRDHSGAGGHRTPCLSRTESHGIRTGVVARRQVSGVSRNPSRRSAALLDLAAVVG